MSEGENSYNDLPRTSEVDIYRDTYIRYLGYANEVGEAFRVQVHVNLVRLSYLVAIGYVCGDARDKGVKAKKACDNEVEKTITSTRHIQQQVIDTLIWQGLASVAIPGFTINRLCYATNFLLKRSSSLPVPVRRWLTTFVGLGAIPFIITPIDRSVDQLMDKTFRRLFPSL